MSAISVFQYWGQGFDAMPSFLKIIYKHNLEFCKKNNLNLILIDDNNVYNYITPHLRFKTLAYNFKSDIIRYYILHKHGGFWFDTDVIIIKDLNNLYRTLSGYECMLDVEFNKKIGCCSLFIKKESCVSKFCLDYINDVLDKKKEISWNDIGPNTVKILYTKHKSLILLNNDKTVRNGCNFICWNQGPGINKEKWYLGSENLAKSKADFLKNNNNCYYLITWNIYNKNNMENNLNNMVFDDKRSVFSYFINYEKEIETEKKEEKKIIVKNSPNSEWNGEYVEGEVNWKDNGSISYVKDYKYHIYQHNGVWRLGESGFKVYQQLGNEIDEVIDLKLLLPSNKYVLCCPINGLNDTFNQIIKCYNYCKKTGRTLLVNTNTNHNQSMRYNFVDYFNFKDTNFSIISDSNIIANLFKKQNVTVINGLNNYLTDNYSMTFIGKESDGANILCDKESKIPLKFDFNKDYDEDVLLHFQGGGGDKGSLLFEHIILNKNLQQHISNKITELPNDYVSLYVRNTDKKSDYEKLLNDNIKIIENENVYLATDSKVVLDYFKNTELKIFNFTTFPNENSINLHNSNLDTKTKIYDALTDLYLIANSKRIITNSSSGYLKLVRELNIKDYVPESTKNGLGFINCKQSLFNHIISVPIKYAVMWASTVNIGDDIQTLAAINFLKKKGITEYTFIDREKLSDYDGEPVTLIMNGWFMHNIKKFPPSNKITPLFISVHMNNERLISNNIDYFKKYGPIGCRDDNTVKLFKKYGIDAYFTGCLTLLFDDVTEKTGGKYLVDVNTKCTYISNIEFDTSKYNDFQIIEHDINNKIKYKKPLYITFIFDKRYIDIFITVVKSIILNEYRNYKSKIIFLINYFGSDEDMKILKKKVKIFQENKFYFKNILIEYPNLCKKMSSCYDIKTASSEIETYSVYCRFYLDFIWQDINDIILYLDLDIIVKKPISELFNLFDNEHVLFACPNSNLSESINANFTQEFNNIFNKLANQDKVIETEYNLQEAGFNGGVWAINLKKFRDGNYSKKMEVCMIVQSKKKLFNHNDQGIMNVIFYKKFKHINTDWNLLDYGGAYNWCKINKIYHRLDENFDNAKIIHYNGPDKPWKKIKHYYPKGVDLWKFYQELNIDYYYSFLTSMSIKERLIMAENLLNKYRTAKQVITTRLHCILPCRAFNTESIFIHKNYEYDPRFQGLKDIINGDTQNHCKTNGDRYEIEKIRNNFLLLKI